MSALLALAEPRRIKASHRRRRKVAAGRFVYQHTDSLGSIVAETDANRAVVKRNSYEPYGGAWNSTIDGTGYTGHVMDQGTGLTYMQQRYYDPVIGRFLSVDPMPSDMNNAWNFNRYNYATNNPYRFKDPDGRAACPGQEKSMCLEASTKIPALKTSVETTPKINEAIVASASEVAVKGDGPEKGVFITSDGQGGLKSSAPMSAVPNTKTGKSTLTMTPPKGVTPVAANHGHIDSGVNKSKGLASSGDGRAAVEAGYPIGVVSHGNIAVVTAPDGRLRIQILDGKIERQDMPAIQKALDQQQRALLEEGR